MSASLRLVAFALLLALAALPARAAEETSFTYRFAVQRDGWPIGTHRVTITERDDATIVDSLVHLEVKLGFLTLFRLHQTVREVWHDGRLVSLDADTDDDGDRFRVTVRPDGDGLLVDGFAGRLHAPADAVPLSYWHPATVSGVAVIDTRKGRVAVPEITDLGWETIEAGRHRVEAHRWRIGGLFRFDVWYDRAGLWQRTTFNIRGGDIDDVAEGLEGDAGRLALLAARNRFYSIG